MQELGLSLAENIVRRALQRGPLTVAEAAEHLALSHSAASRAVDRLVEMGLVERKESPSDRRCRHLTLSRKGQGLLGKLEGTFVAGVEPLLERLSPEEESMQSMSPTDLAGVRLALVSSLDSVFWIGLFWPGSPSS